MTDFQHAMVGGIILMLLWHLFIKRHFITEKDVKTWEDFFKQYW
jgi:hypothetical protein